MKRDQAAVMKEIFAGYYSKMRSYEESTGRDLPYLIVGEEESVKRKALIEELKDVLDGDDWMVGHFLLEMAAYQAAAADGLYELSCREVEEDVESMVDRLSASADDCLFASKYFLDIAYSA